MATHPHQLGELRDCFLAWMEAEARAGRCSHRTTLYYSTLLRPTVEAIGPDVRIADLVPYDLERAKRGWHSVQAMQRLFNWGVDVGLCRTNPFARVKRPRAGQRERTLTRPELARLLRAAARPFRLFLVAMRHTLARPQEIRALRWDQLQDDGRWFALREFKGRARRKDGVNYRLIVLDEYMRGLIQAMKERRSGDSPYVFTNRFGLPWTGNAVRCAMRRARKRAGLDGPGLERVVAYTFRHTAATDATANGVRDRQLADLMGHSSTRTTARYQHLRADHLAEVIDRATARKRA